MKTPNTIIIDGRRKVCRVHDFASGGLDRYTICFKGYRVGGYGVIYPYLTSGEYPGGCSSHGESMKFMTGKHLGKRISFEELPEAVQQFVIDNI